MCPVCGGSSFRAATWISATKRDVAGFCCLVCGALLRSDQVTSTLTSGGDLRETLPAPAMDTTPGETWRPPSQRKPPAVSGTFQAVPSTRRPLRKHG